jgi:hypothetical protein
MPRGVPDAEASDRSEAKRKGGMMELKEAKMIQQPPPLSWRDAELQYLIKAVDLETRLVRLDSLVTDEDEESGG